MKVLDLYAGLRGWSDPFAERGHETFTVDLAEQFDVDLHADVAELRPTDLPWRPDVVLASPPCEKFSVLTVVRNWHPHTRQPRTPEAVAALELVRATVRLIAELAPAYFVVENPVGMLRKLRSGLEVYDRRTVTYCRLGEPFRKPTDLWGGFPPSLQLPPRCRPTGRTTVRGGFLWALGTDGRPCHLAAPRGNRTDGAGEVTLAADTPQLEYNRNRRGNLSAQKRQQRQQQGADRADLLLDDSPEPVPWLTQLALRDAAWHGTTTHGGPNGGRRPRESSSLTSRKRRDAGVTDGRMAFDGRGAPADLLDSDDGAAAQQVGRGKFRGGLIEGMSRLSSGSHERRDLAALRAKIPRALALLVCEAAEADVAAGLRPEYATLWPPERSV